jgi:hypothetical protein
MNTCFLTFSEITPKKIISILLYHAYKDKIVPVLNLTARHVWGYGGMPTPFWTLAIERVSGRPHTMAALLLRKSSGILWTGDNVRNRFGLDTVGKNQISLLPGIELRSSPEPSHYIDLAILSPVWEHYDNLKAVAFIFWPVPTFITKFKVPIALTERPLLLIMDWRFTSI